MEKQSKSKKVFWSVQVPELLNRKLDAYIDEDSFANKSEFIRAAVRDRLQEETERLKRDAPWLLKEALMVESTGADGGDA